jgi:hypothetical protein
MITSKSLHRQPTAEHAPRPRRAPRLRSALFTAAAAGAAFTTLGLTGIGAAGASTAVPQSMGSPVYNMAWAGYTASGRWFRYVSTTLQVPSRTIPAASGGDAIISLRHAGHPSEPFAHIIVSPGGGAGTIEWSATASGTGTFRVAPKAGDQLAISIYYDRNGHDFFTAADLSQGTSQTVKVNVASPVYNTATLAGVALPTVDPPAADTALWQFTGSHLTTYGGDKGTVIGPWTTRPMTATSSATAAGRVVANATVLAHGGQDFTVMLRALPVVRLGALTGYQAGGGRWYRYLATTVTVPPTPITQPALDIGLTGIRLAHTGGPTPGPIAYLYVEQGGGPGSLRWDSSTRAGTFAVSPDVGDVLTISIYYDQQGHNYFTVTDITKGITQTVKNAAGPEIASMPYNTARVVVAVDDNDLNPPATDTKIWAFSGTRVTTYTGVKGSLLGPWATSEIVLTSTGTSLVSPSVLSNGGQDFSVWLRHQ